MIIVDNNEIYWKLLQIAAIEMENVGKLTLGT